MPHLIKEAFYREANYRLAQFAEGAGRPLRWLIDRWVGAPRTPPAQWRRGLIIGADHLGDILCRTGSLPDLAAATPHCEWSYVAGRPGDEVLETNPFIRQVVPIGEDTAALRWADYASLVKGYDVVLDYDLIGYGRVMAAAMIAKVPNRVAFAHKGFSWLETLPVPNRFPTPYAWGFRDLVAQISGRPASHEGRPLVYPTAEDETQGAEAFAALGMDPATPVVACSILTRSAGRGAYAPELYIEALRRAAQKAALHALFLGARSEREKLEKALLGSGLKYDIVTGLGIRALYCFLRRCRAAFTMDSGIRHLANAAHIPVVFTRNLPAHPVETGKYCETEIDVAPSRPWSRRPRDIPEAEITFDPALAAEKIGALIG